MIDLKYCSCCVSCCHGSSRWVSFRLPAILDVTDISDFINSCGHLLTKFRFKSMSNQEISKNKSNISMEHPLLGLIYTAQKTVFLKSWNIMEISKRASKYNLSGKILAQKKPYFP